MRAQPLSSSKHHENGNERWYVYAAFSTTLWSKKVSGKPQLLVPTIDYKAYTSKFATKNILNYEHKND